MEEGECGTPASHLPRFSPRMSTELLTEPKPKKQEAGTCYLEGIQTCCLCLQGEVRQAKAQLESKPAKVDRDKEEGYCKNKRKTKKTVGPLLSDTGLARPILGKIDWLISNVKIRIFVCANQICKIV